ncbi:MAG: tetratricopeptide repeat protein, partial [Candidatus Nanopelagicales bacterium]
LRGEYGEAERLYRQSLEIDERLGDHAGVAMTSGQLGILCAEQGLPVDAVGFHIRALAILLRLAIPASRVAIHHLASLRDQLGHQRFTDAARGVVDEENLANLHALLEDYAKQTRPPGEAEGPE